MNSVACLARPLHRLVHAAEDQDPVKGGLATQHADRGVEEGLACRIDLGDQALASISTVGIGSEAQMTPGTG